MVNGIRRAAATAALALILGLAGAGARAETIQFHTTEWSNYTNADGSGFAWEIVKAVYNPEGIDLQIRAMPYARAVKTVVDGQADAWVGSYADEVPKAVYPEWHYDADRVDAVFRADSDMTWNGPVSLRNKTVAWMRGYRMDRYLDVPVQAHKTNSRISAMHLLKIGRVDAFLDPAIELDKVFADSSAGVAEDNFVRKHVMNLKLYVAFAPTERGQRFAEIWDARFPKLLENRTIAEIYDKYGFELWPYEAPRAPGGS